ncbi:MAG: UDP-N-acetylglucosamine 2-epimerase (non-hydrolyzing) [Schleiferiaceae bacterium]|nr:UDP-N-acetylglucosamine 2-epimerase (non-hydrolyzing) [Schleiferiaceae bacterium]
MPKHIQLLTVIGARPQFVKASVVSRALSKATILEDILHTGQHFDSNMDAVFFEELNIPMPVANLNAGGGTHGEQTAKMMVGIEKQLLEKGVGFYDGILVYGDTNSTLAAALVGAKLQIPIFHIEAGLRSYNRTMPEEVNRVLTDQLSSLLFCPSNDVIGNLAKEGITKGVHVVGDVMHDAFLHYQNNNTKLSPEIEAILASSFILLTLHRPSNTDSPEHLSAILENLKRVKSPILWPVHPRMQSKINSYSLPEHIKPVAPLSYFELLRVLSACNMVITDSGGLQKEAYWAKKKCITLREETEWVETVQCGWNHVVGHGSSSFNAALQTPLPKHQPQLYGAGDASERITSIIFNYFASNSK